MDGVFFPWCLPNVWIDYYYFDMLIIFFYIPYKTPEEVLFQKNFILKFSYSVIRLL